MDACARCTRALLRDHASQSRSTLACRASCRSRCGRRQLARRARPPGVAAPPACRPHAARPRAGSRPRRCCSSATSGAASRMQALTNRRNNDDSSSCSSICNAAVRTLRKSEMNTIIFTDAVSAMVP